MNNERWRGQFQRPHLLGTGSNPVSVAVGDFNGDDRQDLAVANYGSANVSILLGNGAGSFGAATDFGVGTNPNSVAVGDFNGDGKQDLAIANTDSNNVVDLVDGDWRSDADANADTHTNPHGYAYRHTDSDTNAHTYSHCPGDRPNNSRRSRVHC